MPYISKQLRTKFDTDINSLVEKVKACEANGINIDGIVNYILSSMVSNIYDKDKYSVLSRAIAVFECAKLEFYRRVVSDVEDKKLLENSDVYKRSN